jgi:hypothetical protein
MLLQGGREREREREDLATGATSGRRRSGGDGVGEATTSGAQLPEEGHAVARTSAGVEHVDGRAGVGGGSLASVVDSGAGNRREGRPDGEGAIGWGHGGGSVGPHQRPLRAVGREGWWPSWRTGGATGREGRRVGKQEERRAEDGALTSGVGGHCGNEHLDLRRVRCGGCSIGLSPVNFVSWEWAD